MGGGGKGRGAKWWWRWRCPLATGIYIWFSRKRKEEKERSKKGRGDTHDGGSDIYNQRKSRREKGLGLGMCRGVQKRKEMLANSMHACALFLCFKGKNI